VPIVKHPRRRYAIVALWVAWEPERAYSGMRLGILTCWTFVAELSTLSALRVRSDPVRDRARRVLLSIIAPGTRARIHEFKRNVNSDLNRVSGEKKEI
jgi:hypothetical protein